MIKHSPLRYSKVDRDNIQIAAMHSVGWPTFKSQTGMMMLLWLIGVNY